MQHWLVALLIFLVYSLEAALATSMSAAPTCSATIIMCPWTDNSRCDSAQGGAGKSCQTNITLDSGDLFIGGVSGSACASEICTCDIYSSSNLISTLTYPPGNSGAAYYTNPPAYDAALVTGTTNAWDCASKCEANFECEYAYFERHSGECRLLRACFTDSQPNGYANRWVGRSATQGAATFKKYEPRTISYLLSQTPKITSDSWPSEYFGDFAGLHSSWSSGAEFPTWDSWETLSSHESTFVTTGVADGYDWSLPDNAAPSVTGSVANVRTFNLQDWSLQKITDAPVLPNVKQTVECWIAWNDLETADNVFDFTRLDMFLNAIELKGFTAYLRLMTSDKHSSGCPGSCSGYRAPEYFTTNTTLSAAIGDANNDDIPFGPCAADLERGQPWNIMSNEFHTRYLRLVSKMAPYCQSSIVSAVFVGWMSCSNGDEGIGPSDHGYDGHDGLVEPQIVKDRLDAWKAACGDAAAHKVVMGGKSIYGRNHGFGLREGFVEMYWYRPPGIDYASYEGHTFDGNGYIDINESNPLANGQTANVDENEEYSPQWSSEWRCSSCSSLSGGKAWTWDGPSGPQSLGQARWGSIASFPYRYMLSMLRSLHLRMTTLVLDPDSLVSPAISKYVTLSLGHNSETTSDAWCFLIAARTNYGFVKTWDRWLTQRDSTDSSVNGGIPSRLDASFLVTPYNSDAYNPANIAAGSRNYIAKSATELAFALDATFASRVQQKPVAWVKVSFFDVSAARKILLLQGSIGNSGVRSCNPNLHIATITLPATTSNKLQTGTFEIQSPGTKLHAFCVAGRDLTGDPQEVVVSFVRVLISTAPTPSPTPSPPLATPSSNPAPSPTLNASNASVNASIDGTFSSNDSATAPSPAGPGALTASAITSGAVTSNGIVAEPTWVACFILCLWLVAA